MKKHKDGFERVLYRSGIEGQTVSRLNVLKKNIFLRPAYIWLSSGMMVFSLAWLLHKKKVKDINGLLIIALPIVWICLASERSDTHFWFTYRIVGIYVFFAFSLFFKTLHEIFMKKAKNSLV